MAHLIGGLARRHRVAILCLRGDDEAGIEADLVERCEIAEEVPLPEARASGLRARVRGRLPATQGSSKRWQSPSDSRAPLRYCAIQ